MVTRAYRAMCERSSGGPRTLDLMPLASATSWPPSNACSGQVDAATRSSAAASVCFVAAGVMGVGILAVPHACASAGLPEMLCLLVVCAGLSFYTMRLLTLAAEGQDCGSFEALVARLLGRAGACFLAWNILLANFGTAAAYCIVLGDRVSWALGSIWGPSVQHDWGGFAALAAVLILSAPLSACRSVAALRWNTRISLGLISAFVVLVAGYASVATADHAQEHSGDQLVAWWAAQGGLTAATGEGLPVAVFAFSATSQVLPAWGELRRGLACSFRGEVPPPICDLTSLLRGQMDRVLAIAVGFSLAAYAVVGSAGLATFQGNVQEDVMDNYLAIDGLRGSGKALALSLRALALGYGLLMAFAVPVTLFPARRSLNFLLTGASTESEVSAWLLRVEGVGLALGAFAVAGLCRDLITLLDLIGSTSAVWVCVMLPVLLYLYGARPAPSRGQRRVAKAVFCVGTVLGLSSLGCTLWRRFGGKDP